MKKALLILFVFGLCAQMWGQWPIGGKYTDRLSQSNYDDMVEDYEIVKDDVLPNAVLIKAMTRIIRERNESMEIPVPMVSMRTEIMNYIWDGPVASTLPSITFPKGTTIGTARHLLREKYPIIVPYRDNSRFKNAMILRRFSKKLGAERTAVEYYLGGIKTGATDYLKLTEGTRIMLTLDALEKVINITLENEEY